MNTSLFLTVAFGCVSAVVSAAPALAQGEQQRVPASGYCTGETIQISGWETDLVRRNKGLEKFHWSAINTVAHYNVVAPGAYQRPPASKTASAAPAAYHNVKPTVINTWSRGPVVDRSCIASADNSNHAAVSGRLHNTSAYGQLARAYDAGSSGNQPAQYGVEKSADSRVSARLMHY